MNDFDDIISFENLYKAHLKTRLAKRHKREVIDFEAHLSENLWKLHYDLKYGKYEVDGYNTFTIYDPKEREIQAIAYRDRIVQHTLCDNYINPLFEKQYIYDNCACRKGKGTHFAIDRLRYFMTKHYRKYGKAGYFVKLDVQNFFLSIPHSLLLGKIKKLVTDERIYNLIYKIVKSFSAFPDRGLPMGNQSSQSFGLLYLTALDKYIKEQLRVKYYVRYMDDLILLLASKQEAFDCFNSIKNFIISEDLVPNKKSRIIAVKDGLEFLGWRFFYSASGKIIQKIKKQSRRRIINKFNKKRYLCKKYLVMESEFQQTKNSVIAYLKHGNTSLIIKRLITSAEKL